MTREQQIAVFIERLDKLIDTFMLEFDMTYCEIIGIFMMKVHGLNEQSNKEE